MKKSLAIIGGGVSGLTAGIYACQAGFDTTIYEKNAMLGGECTGWNRQGYHIDNCVHFLLGCDNEGELSNMWRNAGVLSEEVSLYFEPYFYRMEMEGVTLHLWRDLERARAEFLEIAPEDAKELNLFFDCVKGAECIQPSCEASPAHMNPFEWMKMVMKMMPAGRANKEYAKQSVEEFASRFQNPFVHAMMRNYYSKDFPALTFVVSYAFYTSHSAAIPEGGSVGMVQRMKDRFEALGGKIQLRAKVCQVEMAERRLEQLTLENQMQVKADAYIWAADPYPLFYKLLRPRYMDATLRSMYERPQKYSPISGYQAAFGITTDEDLELPEGSVIFPCETYKVAGEPHGFCGMRIYDYDASLFPKDKRVIQCNILQDAKNYEYWDRLDRDSYQKEKLRIAEDLMQRIETQYPQLRDKLLLLSTYSPTTFQKWCHAYKGGYMSFTPLKGFQNKYVKSTIQGISNLFLASQWIQTGGGLPIAAASGKFAVDQLIKRFS